MFGKIIEKHCINCDDNILFEVSVGLIIEYKIYHPELICHECNVDLSKEDTLIVNNARIKGKIDGIIMY